MTTHECVTFTADEVEAVRYERAKLGNAVMGQSPHFERFLAVLDKILAANPEPLEFGDPVIIANSAYERGRYISRHGDDTYVLLDDSTMVVITRHPVTRA
jgi:hypothetical protein